MNHLMYDFETLGLRANSWILSFGARFFDPDGQLGPSYECFFNRNTQFPERFKDKNTIDWWEKQGGIPDFPTDRPCVIFSNLHVFSEFFEYWLKQNMEPEKPIYHWARGTMDDVWRMEAQPANYKSVLSYRNFMELRTFERANNWTQKDTENLGLGNVTHNALEDVNYQIKIVQAIHKRRNMKT